ncbi:MAG: serine hydrolase, partial [Gemmatimonadaceae bacterium]
MTLRQLGLAMGLASTLHAQPSEGDLRSRLLARLAHAPGATAGIFVKDLSTGREVGVNADTSFHAASTMKVPVMIEYFRGLDAGRWSPDATVMLRNQFASIVDGSPYSLDAAEDSDSALYVKVGQAVSVRELVYRMITRSSNLATNAVIALVGAESADATAHALGARTIHVRRGVEDNLAYQAGLNNTTSARDLGALLAAIAEGTAVSRARSDEMLGMLEHQEFNDEIPAGLPPG